MEPQSCVAWLDGMLETWAPAAISGLRPPARGQGSSRAADGQGQAAFTGLGRQLRPPAPVSPDDFMVAAVNVAVAIKNRAPVLVLQRGRHGCGLLPADGGALGPGRARRRGQGGVLEARPRRPVHHGRHARRMVKEGRSTLGDREALHRRPQPTPMDGQLHSPALAVRPLWWRSVGNTHTAYVMETMMDQLALAAGQDPLAAKVAGATDEDRAQRSRSSSWPRNHRLGQGDAAPDRRWGIALHECSATVPGGRGDAPGRQGARRPRLLRRGLLTLR